MATLPILQRRCCRSSNCKKYERSNTSRKRSSNIRVSLSRSTHSYELCLCGQPFLCCCQHLMLAALLWAATSLFLLAGVVAAAAPAAAAASDGPLHEAAAAPAHNRPDNGNNAAARDRQEEQTLSPRTVRVALVGGGISSAATSTFLSIMQRQLEHERTAKQQVDEKRRIQREESSDATNESESSDAKDQDDLEEGSEDTEQWWMRRPINFEIDVFEASERYGGRMDYGRVAGRNVELGDVGVNASNFWMTVFHDLLNAYADNVGGPGWSTKGDRAAAGAAAAAAEAATAAAAAAPPVAAARPEAAAPPQAAALAEVAAASGAQSDTTSGPDTSGEVSSEHHFMSEEKINTNSPEGYQQQHAERNEAEHAERKAGQEEAQPEVQPTGHGESCGEPRDGQVENQEPRGNADDVTQTQGDPEGAADTAAPAATTESTPPPANPYLTGWKGAFSFPSPLTEFHDLRPGPTILLHDVKRATPIVSLTLALIKSGATALSEPLKRIVLRWQRIYDLTFGGPLCAKRAALSLFPGRAHYIAPHPSRQHPNGRPYCSVMEQAKAASRTGVEIAEALGLGNEIRQLFSTLIKPYHIERTGQHLIDSLIRGVYAQRAKTVHAFAGALALAGSYDAPYDRKQYSGRVLVEFLIARTVDNSFLNCPIHKIIELEDEIVPAGQQEDASDVTRGTDDGSTVTDAVGDHSGAAGGAKEHASFTAVSAGGTLRRRKRFKLVPASGGGCSNEEARRRLEETVYDFVVVGTPLEDSLLTVYRRVPAQTAERGDTATTEQKPEVSNKKADASPAEGAKGASSPQMAATRQNRHEKSEAMPRGKTEEAQVLVVADSEPERETDDTNNLGPNVQGEHQEERNDVPYEGELQQPEEKQQAERGEDHVRQVEKSQWTLQEVPVVERPYVAVHVTCAATDGLVKYRTDEDRMYGRRRRSDLRDRPPPTTVLTSDSLSQEYYSFGELFVATCHDVVESELLETAGTTLNAEANKSPLILFFSRKGEDQKRRRNSAAKHTGERREGDKTAPPTTTPDQDQNNSPAVKEWKVDTELLSRPSSIKIEGQENEAPPSTVKTLYYTGKSLSPLAAEGFFSRIKESTLGQHFGQTICCAVTGEELDERDLTDVFRNVSHTDRRSWCFARPRLYPIVDKSKRDKISASARAQTYIWGEEEEEPPPTLVPEVTNFVLMQNVFYTSAFESVVSCSEGAVIAAKNVANLIIKEIMQNYDD